MPESVLRPSSVAAMAPSYAVPLPCRRVAAHGGGGSPPPSPPPPARRDPGRPCLARAYRQPLRAAPDAGALLLRPRRPGGPQLHSLAGGHPPLWIARPLPHLHGQPRGRPSPRPRTHILFRGRSPRAADDAADKKRGALPPEPLAAPRRMRVRVRLFAGLRERVGTGENEIELPAGSRASDVWVLLQVGPEPEGLAYAVNRQYVERDHVLADGDELAIIPPVSGGAFRLTEEPLDVQAVMREVENES